MPKKVPSTFCQKPLTLKDFQSLPIEQESILLDNDSLHTMFGIQETIRLLEPQGIDDVRTLLIETIGQRGTIIWYEVSIRIYQDFHWLILNSHQNESFCFCNKEKYPEKGRKPQRHRYKAFLDKLWHYVSEVVRKIDNDPAAYVRYLEEHVPYQEREGTVLRQKIQNLLPGIKIKIKNRKTVLPLLKKHQKLPSDQGYDSMTLRTYIEAWKIAYCAYINSHSLQSEPAEKIFLHSNQGRLLKNYNLDDPAEFRRWDKEQEGFHSYDVVYVCIHLYPEKNEDSGKWYFDLAFGLETFGDEGVRIAFALEKAGIPFTICGADGKLEAINGEDTITFSPNRHGYYLPYPDDNGVKAENLQKAIETINWKPFKTIHGILSHNGKRVRVTFYPCDDAHYPEPEEEPRGIIRYVEEGNYHYWSWYDCPWGWNVLERYQGEFCIMPIID